MDIQGLSKIFKLTNQDIESILELKGVTVGGYTVPELKALLLKYKDTIEEQTGLDINEILTKLDEYIQNSNLTEEDIIKIKDLASILGIEEEKVDKIISIIQNKLNAKNDTVDIQNNHEYILVYRKATRFMNGRVLPTLMNKRYT